MKYLLVRTGEILDTDQGDILPDNELCRILLESQNCYKQDSQTSKSHNFFRIDSNGSTGDFQKGYEAGKKALEDDDPVKKARAEQNDRISGKAGVVLNEFDPHSGKRKDSLDTVEAARAEQIARITRNNK